VRNWCRDWERERAEPRGELVPASLLDATAKVVAETGFRSVDFASLAEKLGCPVAHLEKEFGSELGLAVAIARSCAARAYAHFGKAMLAPPERRLAEAKESLRNFLEFIDLNEDYFRLGLWFYVERRFEITDGSGRLRDEFFDQVEEFFTGVPSSRSARDRATAFANSWLTYAWFRWVEFPNLRDRERAEARLAGLRETLIGLLD
jgi:AcrR family transcriptional regulator